MLQASIHHTVGNRRLRRLDYNEWLDQGTTVVTATVTSSSTTCTVADVVVAENYVYFFTVDGELNEELTLSVQMVDSKTGIKNDTIAVKVIAP